MNIVVLIRIMCIALFYFSPHIIYSLGNQYIWTSGFVCIATCAGTFWTQDNINKSTNKKRDFENKIATETLEQIALLKQQLINNNITQEEFENQINALDNNSIINDPQLLINYKNYEKSLSLFAPFVTKDIYIYEGKSEILDEEKINIHNQLSTAQATHTFIYGTFILSSLICVGSIILHCKSS